MSVKKTEIKPWVVRAFPVLIFILAIIGFIASFTLTIEKIELIKDPSFQPSCNISPLISCGSVMKTEQAEAFGFPNSIIGIVGFTMMGVIGLALLAGARFKRWFWLTFQVGVLFGLVFVHWLMYQSIFNIGALCPYCMIVWSVTIPAFWYVTLYNLSKGHLVVSKKFDKVVGFAQNHHLDILIFWFLAITSVILYKFWYYWSTLI